MKKIWMGILVSVLLISNFNVVSYGASIESGEEAVIAGSSLLHDDFSEATIDNVLRGNLLNQGTTRISNKGNGQVNAYGAVFGSVTCDKLILRLTLQRYQNGTWVDVKNYSDTAYNTAFLSKSYTTSVTKGYYYRVKAACIAQKGSDSESKMPVTDGIWID